MTIFVLIIDFVALKFVDFWLICFKFFIDYWF